MSKFFMTTKDGCKEVYKWLSVSACVAPIFLFLISCSGSKEGLVKNAGATAPDFSEKSGGTSNIPSGSEKTNSIDTIQMIIAGGNFQSAASSQSFSNPLAVQVLKGAKPLADTIVSFSLQTLNGGTFTQEQVSTDQNGLAKSTFVAGTASGSIAIKASVMGVGVDFTLTVIPQSTSTMSMLAGNNQSAHLGQAATDPLKVSVRTAEGSVASGVLVRFTVQSGNARLNNTSNTIDVVSNSLGVASADIYSGTIAGVQTITASLVANPTQSVSFSLTSTVSPSSDASVNQSLVSSSKSTMQGDGIDTAVLTLTAKDQYGNLLGVGGKSIVFAVNQGTLLGSVADNGNGTYTQTVRSPAGASSSSILASATINASAVVDTESILLTSGGYSTAASTISVSPSSLTAGTTGTALITVTLRDALGTPLTTGGQTVAISASGLTLVGSVVDNGNGTYSRVVQNSAAAASYTISATINTVSMTNTASLAITPGAVNISQSRIVATPSTITPDGASTSTIAIVAKDQYGNALTSSAGTATLSTTLGSWQAAITDNANGTYSRTLVASATPGTATVSGTLAGSALTPVIVYMSSTSGPSTANSTVNSAGSIIAADGSSTTTVTVTLKDSANAQMTSGGSTVVISTTAGVLIGSVTDVGNGTYTQVLRSANASAIATVTATFDGRSIVDTAVVSMYGAISLATSDLSTSPTALAADGTSTALVILQAKDANGILIPVGGAGTVAFTTTNGTLLTSAVDNSNGTYTQTLRAPGATGSATVSATLGGSAFSDTASVTYYSATGVTTPTTINCTTVISGGFKNNQLVVNGTTVTLDTWSCPSDSVFTSVIIKNNGILTHSTSTTSVLYGLVFTADYLQIDAGSQINVDGKGYLESTNASFRVQGNSSFAVGAGIYTGGVHGGGGGNTTTMRSTYGSIFEPSDLGGSGACNTTSVQGGGRVKIVINPSGSLVNNGSITASGAGTNNVNWGSAAGGSVWISTPTLSGSGAIAAQGGGGASTFRGAGGGRIAIYSNTTSGNFAYPTNFLTNVLACGGQSTIADNGGHAGTIFLKRSGQTYGDLIINNCGYTTSNQYTYTQIDRPTVTDVTNVTATTVSNTGLFAAPYATFTSTFAGWFIDPKIDQNVTSTKSDNTLYKVTAATPDILTISTGDMTTVAGYSSTDQVELMLVFDNLEVRGNAKLTGSTAHILVLEGDVSSNDTTTAVVNGMLSDGVEYRNADVTITNSGNLGTFDPRVEEWKSFTTTGLNMTGFGTMTTTGNISLTNVTNLTLSQASAANLTVSGSTLTMSCLRGAASCINLTGSLTLSNTSTLTQSATTSSNEYALGINAYGLTINSGCSIDVTGKGFAYQAASYSRSFGNTNVYPIVGSSGYYFGGSHGGRGGGYTAGSQYVIHGYGSILAPYESGSSGSTSGAGSGGGILKVVLNGGSLVNNGSMIANGHGTGAVHVSGGAGGSIWIDAGAISGTGTVNANGGAMYASGGATGESGGGGRIAIYYSSVSGNFSYPTNFISNVTVKPGAGGASVPGQGGAAGTLYAKSTSQTYGDLIIDAGNVSSMYALTVLNMPSNSTSTGLAATALTKSNAFGEDIGQSGGTTYDTDHLTGFYVNPNIAQNGTSQWSDDTLFKITGHDKDVLNVSGDMTSVGSSGDTYGIALVLDNLEIRGGARVLFNGKVIVKDGDVTSGDTSTFSTTGYLEGSAQSIEFGTNVTSITANVSSSTSVPVFLPQASNAAVTLSNGTFALSGKAFPGNLTVTSSSITSISGLNVTGNFSATNSTISAGSGVTVGGNFSLSSMTASNFTDVNVVGNMTMTATTMTAGTVGLTKTLNITGDLSMDATSSITSLATTPSTEYRMYISAANITVPSGAIISAVDKGYCMQTSTYIRSQGNQNTLSLVSTTISAAGGAHGGYGSGGTGNTNYTYGSFKTPTTIGSSGTYNVNCGGGAIRITTPGTLSLDGTISSNAFTMGQYGAGAGGSVWLDLGTLTGSGLITARGAASTSGHSGGGGRIAIYYTTLGGLFSSSFYTKVTAYGGGAGGVGVYAAAGTVFAKTPGQAYGDLIIDNNGQSSTADTFIRGQVSTTSSALTATKLTSANSFADTYNVFNHLTDFLIDPRTNYGTSTLSDNLLLPITSNTLDEINVASGLTSLSAVSGDPYRVTLKLDNLEVRGSGRLAFPSGNIIVLEGDRSSGNTTSMVVNGVIQANVLDVGSAVMSGGTITVGSYKCNSTGCPAP
ncbi:MAG: Ig-like domain-containing protein [Proteobacteria bacterium]|nr:Ig-like domain-containing protein [Pseudomonadota bacterium]